MNDTTNASTAGAPRRRRKSRKGLIFTLVVLVAAGGSWYGWKTYKASKAKEGEYMTAPVNMGNVEDLVTSTGKLQPRDYVDVGAQVSGQIEELLVEVGDVVKKGQPLVKIDATTSEAKVESQRIQLESAQNSLLSQIESLEKSKRDFERQKNLLELEATTKQSYLDAETAYKNAERQKVNSELAIKRQRSDMQIEEKNLSYTTVIAPIDGTVMSIAVKLGQTVNASQNVPNVLRIANLTTMTVQSEVSEADVAKLYKGIPVYFTTLGGGSKRWYGELKRIEPTPKEQNSVVLYNALFDVQNDGSSLMPSMTAQVYFVSAEANNVLLVPMAALTLGSQIARELQQKEREKNGEKKPAGAPGMSGGPGAAPGAGAGTTAAREGNAAPAAAAVAGSAPPAAAPGAVAANGQQANGQGNRQGNTQGNAQGNRQGGGGQGMRAGQPGAGQGGGGFGGQRGGGAGQGGGGFGGQRGGGSFNPQNMTPEQIAQAQQARAARMQQGGGGFGGQRPGGAGQQGAANGQRAGGPGGGLNGQRPGRVNFDAMPATNAGPRPVQQRRGTVMVKKPDGTLVATPVVVGVTDRVHGQVISGLKEGDEVVVAKRETEAPAAARPAGNNNQNFQQNRGQGGFQGGGRPF